MRKCGGKTTWRRAPVDLPIGGVIVTWVPAFRRRARSGAGRPAQRRDSGCRYTCRRCDPSSSGHGDDRDDVPTFRGELLVVEVPEFRVLSIDFLDFRVPTSELLRERDCCYAGKASRTISAAALSEARTTLPESSSLP